MTREEVFVPSTRSQKVVAGGTGKKSTFEGVDFDELLEDAPIYRLYYLLVQQVSTFLAGSKDVRPPADTLHSPHYAAVRMARLPLHERLRTRFLPRLD